MLLDQTCPPDLHPSRVPFKRRTLTVMERAGLFDTPTAIDNLTEDDVLGWENAGIGTLRDFIDAGIAKPHGPAHPSSVPLNQLRRESEAFSRRTWVAGGPWPRRVARLVDRQ